MAAKAILVLCAQALLIQSSISQCLNRGIPAGPVGLPNRGWGYDSSGYDGYAWNRGLGCTGLDFAPTSGGSLPVTSYSTAAPTGIAFISENAYEGILSAAGEVPFIGTAAVEGVVPTVGVGTINYGCGNGVTEMVSEGLGPSGYGPAIAPGFRTPSEFGYGRGYLY